MMKFINILKEEKEGKTVTFTNMDRKFLNILQKKKVDPKVPLAVIKYLTMTLAIDDPDLVTRLTKLYHFNWQPGMFECDEVREVDCELTDFSEMKKGRIDVEEGYDAPIEALSLALDVDPFFITETWGGQLNLGGNTYLPEYNVIYPSLLSPNRLNEEDYLIARGWDQAYDAGYTRVREDWEENGIEWFSESFVEPFTEVSYEWIENEAERRAHDDAANAGDEEDMREVLGVTTDYNSYLDDIGFVKEDIVKVLTQIQEAEFKRDEIEKEKILLEKEIETLGGDIEYDDDNPNYTEFSEEIERLQTKLNQMEGWFEETKTIIELLYQDHSNLQLDIKEIKETLSNYEGEKLLDDYFIWKTEEWKDIIEREPLDYLSNYMDMTLGDAIEDGYITVDEEALIEGAIEADGISHFLATQDGHEEMEEFDGTDYYFYRIS